MQIRAYLLSAAAVLLPLGAAAQDFGGAITLGYGKSDIAGTDLNSATIDGRMTYDFGNGFSVAGDLSFANIDIDGATDDVSAMAFGLQASYGFTNGMRLGAYAERGRIEFGGTDVSLTSYGVTGGYRTGNADFGVFVGMSDLGGDASGFPVDIRDMGITLAFDITPELRIGGVAMTTDLEIGGGGGINADVDTIGVAGVWNHNAFSVFGGVVNSSILANVDFTTGGIGIGYDLSGATGFGGVVSLELARTRVSMFGMDEDLDTVRLGFTVPFGAAAPRAPLNSVAGSILSPRRSAITSGIIAAF